MSAFLVLCTCSNDEEANKVARAVVNEKLAACVNILPRIQSIYRWQGAVETANEILLLIKTTEGAFPNLRDRIEKLHSYDTPEIIALPITAGSEKYLAWLTGQVV